MEDADGYKERRRTSHEVRGLKWLMGWEDENGLKSHLTRGAWIEINEQNKLTAKGKRRTSHEVRGLK